MRHGIQLRLSSLEEKRAFSNLSADHWDDQGLGVCDRSDQNWPLSVEGGKGPQEIVCDTTAYLQVATSSATCLVILRVVLS